MYSERGEMHICLGKVVGGGDDFAERGILFFLNVYVHFLDLPARKQAPLFRSHKGLNSTNTNEQRNQFLEPLERKNANTSC